MTTMAYKEAYLTLKVDMDNHYSPVKDITKYIDKLVMIGHKYRCLEKSIRQNLESMKGLMAAEALEEDYLVEMEVLDLMTARTLNQYHDNEKIALAMDAGHEELNDLVHDFQIVRLAVKSKSMSAKGELQELLCRLDRHRPQLLVK